MKRCFLFFLGFAFILTKAQADELPFAVGGYPTIWVWDEGTVNAEFPAFWHTNFHTREGDIFNLTNKIVGDSIVNGKTYGRMVFGYETKDDLLKGIGLYPWGLPHGKTEYADTLLYRQEGDQVFCIPKGKQEEILIMDFGLKKGESFVDATGEQFRVEYAGMLWEDFTDDWITVANVRIRCFYWLQSPKMLKMVSQRTGETDIWIEGIGSLNWGVVPLFVAEGIEPFRHLNQHPRKAQVCVGAPENMNVMPNVNGEEYKAVQIVDWKYAYDDDDSLEFSFEKDTLCIRGIQEVMSHTGLFYAECLITESRIDFMVKQNEVNGLVRIAFDVKIPGFKPGTYHIGDLELVCKGALADYHPFIEEGKEWVCTTYTMLPPASEDETEPNYRITEETYTIGKDTLIQGRTCIGMERDRFQKRYFYEDGDKVYRYNTENEKFYLIYDFGCQVGDRFTVVDAFSGTMRWWDENFFTCSFTCSVTDVDTVKTKDGMELRRITLEAEDVLGEHTTETWIEGIGSVYGPLHNVGATLYMGASMTLDSCTVSNHILYPFSASTDIRAINLTPQTRVETPIYDLSGRAVITPRRGIYIQGGRKVVKHWK